MSTTLSIIQSRAERSDVIRVATRDEFLVRWDEFDLSDPRQWPLRRRLWVTFQLGILAFAASVASSITSPASDTIKQEVGISKEVAVLQISLYV